MKAKILVYALPALILATIHVAEAQQPKKVPRLGMLLYSTPEGDPNVAAFRRHLRELGYIEGQNLEIDYRFAQGKPERLGEAAADLVRLQPNAILALGGDVVPAAQEATKTIPIVMWVSNDPVQSGLVASLAHPGGNITGVTLILDELAGKRLALLNEIAPKISRVAVVWNPDHADPEFRELQKVAQPLKIHLQSLAVRRAEDFPAQFQAASSAKAQALIVVSSRLINLHRRSILDYAARDRIPLIGDWGPWVDDGGLMPYGPNTAELARRVAVYVDKILKGAVPAGLPIERPTKFEFAINLKTAKSLQLSIPQSVLFRADKVIK